MPTEVAPDPIRKALVGKLLANTDLTALLGDPNGIHHRTIPQKGKYPAVVIHSQSDTTEYTFKADLDNEIWTVKAICSGAKADAAETISRLIRSTLHRAELTVPGLDVLIVKRLSGLSYGEAKDGEQYHHEGSMFRVLSQPTS